MTLWLVTYQIPFDFIVGIYNTEEEANKKISKIKDKHAPIIYPCFSDMISSQSGFRKYHIKILNKMLGE